MAVTERAGARRGVWRGVWRGAWRGLGGALVGVAVGALVGASAAHGDEARGGAAQAPRWRAGDRVLTVDRIEDDWVVLEVGEGQRVDIPLRAFPEGLGEGERVSFVRAQDGAQEAAERERALERLRRLRGEAVGQLGAQARAALGCL